MYLSASQLKIDKVIKECAKHLIKHLSLDNCVEIRSLPGIARNKEFVQQVDSFIAKEVRNHQASINKHLYLTLIFFSLLF